MWQNFFKVALRNIRKNQIFSLINISGLAIGFASAILILLFISGELSFDRFHEKSDRIYRMYVDGRIGEQEFRGAWTSMVMGPTFAEEIPEIENYVRFDIYNQQLIWSGGEKYIEDHFMFADSSIFDIFSIRMVKGDPETALKEPRSIVLTEAKARRYFGDEDPIGKLLTINRDSNYYKVTGVMEELPENSHFFCDFIASMVTLDYSMDVNWFMNSIYTYLLLDPRADYGKVEEKMSEVLLANIRGELETFLGVGPEEWQAGGNSYGVYLQPLKDIHLNPDIEVGGEICFRPVNDKAYIYIFSMIAFFILIIASINFMNLATARASVRVREIGLRKVVGSDRRQLILQFLTESIFLSFLAIMLALFIVEICLPWFNSAMDMQLSFSRVWKGYFVFSMLFMALLIGLLSGMYPALFLARYEPIEGIKGALIRGHRSGIFRSIMVVVQFTISVAIIIGTLIVSLQVRYMLRKDLGFDKEHLVVLKRVYPLGDDLQLFCRQVEKIPGVIAASNSTTYLGYNNNTASFRMKGRDRSQNFLFALNYADQNFLNTYGLELVSGRYFDPDIPGDSTAVVINQSAVDRYSISDPLSSAILEPDENGVMTEMRIIGVVKDFHHSSLKEPIGPYMLINKTANSAWSGYISIRLRPGEKEVKKTLVQIQQVWSKMTLGEPFQFFFLNDELNSYYKEEKRTGRVSLMFSLLAIFIACMGLFGLTLFNTQRRTKEIGIRKAMGARARDVLFIVSREILILMGFSVMLAWILAFYFMQGWLADFPYNIGFRPWLFIIAAAAALLIALATVSFQAIRAARSNPVDALHYE
ncbi:MAG: ABC transporter permease [Bacteroidota bacterium]